MSKLHVQDSCTGKLRRQYTNIRVSPDDVIMYAGTMSGDIVKIQLNCPNEDAHGKTNATPPVLLGCFGRHNPKKPAGKDCEKYGNGVRDLLILSKQKQLVIGAGDGTIELVEERNVKFTREHPSSPTWPQLKSVSTKLSCYRFLMPHSIIDPSQLKRCRVNGAVSTLQLKLDSILIGTDACEIYVLHLTDFNLKLVITCNTSAVYDIAFPQYAYFFHMFFSSSVL